MGLRLRRMQGFDIEDVGAGPEQAVHGGAGAAASVGEDNGGGVKGGAECEDR